VPAHTEALLKRLCSELASSKTDAEIDRILPELRSALEEHVRLAKESLEAQVIYIAASEPAA
jgi:hypothetical protein